MKKEALLALEASYKGKLPIEYDVNNGGGNWSPETQEKMKNVDPGNDLLEYIIQALKDDPDHLWASYALRDRLNNYFNHAVKLETALGVKRHKDVRTHFKQESKNISGLSRKADIVRRLKNRKKDVSDFEEVAEDLNNASKHQIKQTPHYSASTVRDIYYANHENQKVLNELSDWEKNILEKINNKANA